LSTASGPQSDYHQSFLYSLLFSSWDSSSHTP